MMMAMSIRVHRARLHPDWHLLHASLIKSHERQGLRATGLVYCVQGQIFELKDGAGTIAPIVLKAAKKAALISDLEREWNVGQKIATLADEHGNLPGFMKVGPALRRPDGKIVGDRPDFEPICSRHVLTIVVAPHWVPSWS